MWLKQLGISGHTQEVQSVAWAPDGSYLLSTGLDQTTRLFAEWKRDGITSWHEIARPQIHGYDLNCLATLTPHQFVSGAEEKLLRVFNKPKATQALLSALSGDTTISPDDLALPDAANIPVLGLSNKAITATDDDNNTTTIDEPSPEDASPNPSASTSTPPTTPPVEDHLSRQTLWPEHEKLYGHGYEISCVASNTAGTLVATACKASSLDHAVIRLYETKDWREIKPPLAAHSLTVTSLAFSPDDRFLLSVGRDRQWVLFRASSLQEGEREGEANGSPSPPTYTLLKSNPKGHSRMILDCAWAPLSENSTSTPAASVFATAGRDKFIKLWRVVQTGTSTLQQENEVELLNSLPTSSPVTALSFSPEDAGGSLLAYGTEKGGLGIVRTGGEGGGWGEVVVEDLGREVGASRGVTCLRWRPGMKDGDGGMGRVLAVSSEDYGVRLVRV